jgi:hypothetical protein
MQEPTSRRRVDPFDMVGPDGGGGGNSLSAQFSNESDYYEYVEFSSWAGNFESDKTAIKKANENEEEPLPGYNVPEIEVLDKAIINDYQFRKSVNFIQSNLDNLTSYSWNKLNLNANISIDANLSLFFEGVKVITSTIGDLKDGAAFTLPGIGIFVNPKDITNLDLLRHEFGHVLQYNRYGRMDFLVIILTSIYSAAINEHPHQKTWTEAQANTLSYYYFNEPKNWSEDYTIDENYLKIIKR